MPADLGFYDLRLPEAREAQAELARGVGIEAFCYWHYWFEGKRLLERPVQAILQSGEPDFPFCLAWANESWSRRWLGEERDVLMAQTYSADDDRAHAEYLAAVFSDNRYLRVDGRPVFLVYRPTFHDNPSRFIHELGSACARAGISAPYLIAINAHARTADYEKLGFTEVLDFQPQLGALPGALADGISLQRLRRNAQQGVLSTTIRAYAEAEARRLFNETRPPSATVPCVFVGWDNTPRRGKNATVIRSAGPASYSSALRDAVGSVACKPPQERLVFINAWNEWAEGNHLEPDQHGHDDYLRATASALLGAR